MKFNAKIVHKITSWMAKRRETYLHHDTQNATIRLLAFIILRDKQKISTIAYCTGQWPMKRQIVVIRSSLLFLSDGLIKLLIHMRTLLRFTMLLTVKQILLLQLYEKRSD